MSEKMSKEWVKASKLNIEELTLPVRQAYVWFITADERVVIVSKDGEEWQLPGGKPKEGEELRAAAARELREETGILLEDVKGLVLFGANHIIVVDDATDAQCDEFLQLRFFYRATIAAENLVLTPDNEDAAQSNDQKIMHVRAVTAQELKELIPWLAGSDEYGDVAPLMQHEV